MWPVKLRLHSLLLSVTPTPHPYIHTNDLHKHITPTHEAHDTHLSTHMSYTTRAPPHIPTPPHTTHTHTQTSTHVLVYRHTHARTHTTSHSPQHTHLYIHHTPPQILTRTSPLHTSRTRSHTPLRESRKDKRDPTVPPSVPNSTQIVSWNRTKNRNSVTDFLDKGREVKNRIEIYGRGLWNHREYRRGSCY